jgi:hypothetical protein
MAEVVSITSAPPAPPGRDQKPSPATWRPPTPPHGGARRPGNSLIRVGIWPGTPVSRPSRPRRSVRVGDGSRWRPGRPVRLRCRRCGCRTGARSRGGWARCGPAARHRPGDRWRAGRPRPGRDIRLGRGERGGAVSRFADQAAVLLPPGCPLLLGEQERGRVGIAARAGNMHIAAAQPVAQRQQHRQVAVVGRQAFLAGGPRVAHPLHADALARKRPDLPFGDVGIQGDRQNLIQQHLAVLALAGAFGQRLLQAGPGRRFPPGDGLIEQEHHLIEHVDRGLGQQRQQDRIPPLRRQQ